LLPSNICFSYSNLLSTVLVIEIYIYNVKCKNKINVLFIKCLYLS
jgi:hypothetical protein